MTVRDTESSSEKAPTEKGLARTAQALARATEKWFPDAYIFALVGVLVVAVAAFANGSSPQNVVDAFGNGFWDLTAFTLQMAMVVLTGYVVATSPPVARLITRLAALPNSPRTAVSFVALMSCSVSFLNWGLSLVFGGLLARAIARRTDLRVDYRALGAAAFMGLGAVWALGMSSSAAQLQATASSLPPALLQITGVLDFGTTIFTWQSLLMCVIIIVLTVIIAHLSAPTGPAIKTADAMSVDLDDTIAEPPTRTRPGEWLEYSRVLPILAGAMTLGWLVSQLLSKPVLSVVSSLNGYLLVFLMLGLVLHGTPRRFLDSVAKAVPATAGILVQFPLYAAMAAILTKSEGRGGFTVSEHLATFFTEVGGGGAFAVVIAVYTVILGLFVPSGGGKWLVEAPYVMQSATDVQMNLGWTVQIYNVAEALPNLINPFFMLPLLAVLGLRARDLIGFTFLQFIFHFPVVLLLVWLLGTTFTFEAPVIPA
ncbi:Short chain fatty acid transporter [Rhodococcus sp. Leaf7]|jgi:short-chain fatty acids transporter|uniref:short-chain fatty acid transporter n=1 Tax=unclassified Rhodococcus (in: high G+C Gram-positive bacteria) TaxID=192944 RepID=UPI0005AC618D|nr:MULTISPECIES: TIGR00366 family protein [unclassified Rhodococcus (in: high G+C Gram-positive bacteria)]KIQ19854.1 Short chain fatty acid transporter [Rhodococcus sp. MEB064]KQU06671.1 Short chain fatty acid transporter [Rhodococcus sp. Leaf7]KQU42191.1 Short chain fatty acid transporter [Rhodococcus sp. Leaf247]